MRCVVRTKCEELECDVVEDRGLPLVWSATESWLDPIQ